MNPTTSVAPQCLFSAERSDEGGLRDAFSEHGFFIVRGGLSQAALSDVRAQLAAMFATVAPPGEDIFSTSVRLDAEDKPLLYRIHQAATKLAPMAAIRLECLRWVRMILGDGPYITPDECVLFGLPDDHRLVYDWHQEGNYMPGLKQFCNLWFPVFDPATLENGTMSVLAGSHKLGLLPYTKQRVANNSYTSLIPHGIESIVERHEEVACLCAPGDLVVFHENLIHRSNHNRSGRTRFSGVLRLMRLVGIPERLSFSNEMY